MTSHNFLLKLTDSSGWRARPGIGLLTLGAAVASLSALSWLLRRFAPAPQAVVTVVVLCVLTCMLVALLRRDSAVTERVRTAGPVMDFKANGLPIDESGTKAALIAMQHRSTLLNEVVKPDEAWAVAVISYEAAMQRLAAGKPGSRSEAQTRALELARLQGLLIQASRPHLPLGLELGEAGLTAYIL